ncbi:pyridoxamine 5'-phosphate oxidase family protein [Xanthomarina sp. GH4-25]|uniref:pyridoxamine 5'-phosphate oxidase family protein n=1 Tax=Xanthomarina sp. GH4-25 TaxID=3349335 RepID=UPI003878149A
MITNIETKECHFILENNYIGHLGYIFQNKPFVVPITYYFDKKNNHIICYSGEGHKIQAMRKNNTVSIQIAEIASVNNWKSVLIHGHFELYFGSEAKAYLHEFSLGVKDVIIEKEHIKPNQISDFSSKIYKGETPFVFLIKITDITGKKRMH